jgi:hypothetical protein
MGDSGEGLVDAHARIEERLEERERSRRINPRPVRDPEALRKLESLRLARTELERQRDATSVELRRNQLTLALDEVNRQIAAAEQSV